MKYIAGVIVTWLIRHGEIKEEKRELYEYAVHCFALSLAPVLYAVIIGEIMNEIVTSIILIIPFTIVRKFCGGFHAKNEWTCLISSCFLVYVCVVIARSIYHSIWLDIIMLLAIAWLINFSPIDSENRRLDLEEKKTLKKDIIFSFNVIKLKG